MHDRKKLLIMIEWFKPGYKAGGPIQSCINLSVALKELYDVYVFTTDTDHGERVPYKNIIADTWVADLTTGVPVYYASKQLLSPGRVSSVIDSLQPDFIYLNLLFSPYFVLYPLWLKVSNRTNAKMILCPRGTLYNSAISLKRYLKKPFLSLVKWMGIHRKIIFHATNQREETAILQYFPGSKIIIADNLPNTVQPPFITCSKKSGDLRCIFISRIVPIKNLLFLLQLLREIQYTLTLTIIGPIEDESYWADCEKAIAVLPVGVKVSYEGAKQNSELPALLQQNHLFILPTTGENFGHAIFESLLAGRPVLISDQTPWQNLTENKAGWALRLNNPTRFAGIINGLAASHQAEFDEYARAAWSYANNFIGQPGLIDQYKRMFQ